MLGVCRGRVGRVNVVAVGSGSGLSRHGHKRGEVILLINFKKEIVNRMYHCVIQYHQPHMIDESRFCTWGVA